jgi:rubrerythrin
MEKLAYMIGAAIVFIVVLVVFCFMLKKLYKLNREYKRYDEIDRYVTYTCPECGKVMENGFVMAGKGICYRADEAKPLSQFIGPKTLLKNTMNMTMSTKENVAWRCKDCNYILVDHSFLVGKKKAT